MENTENTILIVDDDETAVDLIKKVIQSSGCKSVTAASGKEALGLLSKNSFSMILLDIDLPGSNGFRVIRKMRAQEPDIPIIAVSGRTGDRDIVNGLDSGADDYITKPLNPVILGARIRALLKRSAGRTAERNTIITAGPFTYNATTFRIYKNGTEVLLTGKENKLMKVFLDYVNTPLTSDRIYDLVWGDSVVYDNSLMVYINRLRRKIEDDAKKPSYIQNVRGVGYCFVIAS